MRVEQMEKEFRSRCTLLILLAASVGRIEQELEEGDFLLIEFLAAIHQADIPAISE
jgi:hypothetical protein